MITLFVKNQAIIISMAQYKVNGVLLFVLLIGLLGISLHGRPIPRDKEMYKKIGRFEVRPYKYGLYLTQPASNVFYNISPYDFYYLEPQGQEHRLLERGSTEVFSNEYWLTQSSSSFPAKLSSVLSYFNYQNPKSTFLIPNEKTVLLSEKINNSLFVTLSQYSIDIPTNNVTMTLSFNSNDFIFDDSGNLYNNPLPEDVSDFVKVTQFPLKYYQFESPKRYIVGQQYLFIANRSVPGVIRINLHDPQYDVVYVNLEKQLIEFDIKNLENAKVKVELYDSLERARNDR